MEGDDESVEASLVGVPLMAVTVSTKFRSTSGDQNSRAIGFIVRNAESDIDAIDAVELAAPLTYDGLVRSDIQITEIKWPGEWEATVNYQRRPDAETGSIEFSFDIGVESQHIVQSKSTINTYTAPGAPYKNFGGGINVTDNEAQGIDIRVPTSVFQLSYYPTVAVVTPTYQKAVRDLCGKVNNTTFREHAAGEVMFVGCSGRSRDITDWELTFKFEVRPNRTNISIGEMTGISCDGWDVLWCYFGYRKDTNTMEIIKYPTQCNIERVYDRANFATVLGFS